MLLSPHLSTNTNPSIAAMGSAMVALQTLG